MNSTLIRRILCHAPAAGILLLGSLFSANPVKALLWVVGSDIKTDINAPITGSFAIDDELADTPIMLSSNIGVDGLVFGPSYALISHTPGLGVTAIDWLDPGNNLLSFVFAVPLTNTGGNVALDDVASTYTPFDPGFPYSVTGSVTASSYDVPGPFPLFGTVAAVAWSRKMRRRIAMSERRCENTSSSTDL